MTSSKSNSFSSDFKSDDDIFCVETDDALADSASQVEVSSNDINPKKVAEPSATVTDPVKAEVKTKTAVKNKTVAKTKTATKKTNQKKTKKTVSKTTADTQNRTVPKKTAASKNAAKPSRKKGSGKLLIDDKSVDTQLMQSPDLDPPDAASDDFFERLFC